jgi:hypothetical protein
MPDGGIHLKLMLEMNANVNMYMFHGGTNFGYLNGANYGFSKGEFHDQVDAKWIVGQ